MSGTNATAPNYDTHSQAQEAVEVIQRSAIEVKKSSIVVRSYHFAAVNSNEKGWRP